LIFALTPLRIWSIFRCSTGVSRRSKMDARFSILDVRIPYVVSGGPWGAGFWGVIADFGRRIGFLWAFLLDISA